MGYLEIVIAARANENIVVNNASGYLLLSMSILILTVFLEPRSGKTARFSEQIMSADKYPSIFSRQMEAIVYISNARSWNDT